MAYNINTLNFTAGELIKADKLQFIVEYIKRLGLKITSSTFIDVTARGSSRPTLPSGGTWFYWLLYYEGKSTTVMSGPESYTTINYVTRIGADSGLLSGGSRLPTGMGTASTVQVEGFAFKVSD